MLRHWHIQQKLKICVQLQGCNPVQITEVWWGSSHDWSATMDGSKLFREVGTGGWGGGAVLHMSTVGVHWALCGVEEEPAEGLWVRISRQANGWCCVSDTDCLLKKWTTLGTWSLVPGGTFASRGPLLWVCIALCLLGNCDENTSHGTKPWRIT